MDQMNAMILARIHDLNHTDTPLVPGTMPIPTPGDHEILIRVAACGVCRTEQECARSLGAVWAGHTSDTAPAPLDRIIDTTPAWTPVGEALRNLKPGGRLVINAIRKEARDRDALLHLDYSSHLWHEKEIKSVANVARSDVSRFLALADQIPLLPEVETFPLESATRALMALKNRRIRGAKVLVMAHR